MELTLDLLLYYLRKLNPSVKRSAPEAVRFIGLCQLYEGIELSQMQENAGLEEETYGSGTKRVLYIAELSVLLSLKDQLTDRMTVIASADCKWHKDMLKELPCGLVIVNGRYSVPYLSNTLINVLRNLTDWDKNMHIAALEGKSIQDIVNLSEEVIGRPVLVFDGAFDLLAYTKNISMDYAYFLDTTRRGFTDAKILALTRRHNILGRLKKGELLVDSAVGDDSLSTIYHAFYGDGNIIGYACIFYGKESMIRGYLDLVRMFVANLDLCLKREFDSQRFGQMLYETFLLNLLNQQVTSEEQINEQIQSVDGITKEGRFLLGVITFANRDAVPVKFLAKQLEKTAWNIKPFIYQEQICFLKIISDKETSMLDHSVNKIIGEGILDHYPHRIGFSNEFYKITDLRHAYRQAKVALELTDDEEGGAAWYQDICYEDLFSVITEKMPPELLRMGLYRKLREYDRWNRSNYCDMILQYIHCDCNATHTAEQMYLHRNTIRNAVLFVEETWNVQIRDPEVKKVMILGEMVDRYLAKQERKTGKQQVEEE